MLHRPLLLPLLLLVLLLPAPAHASREYVIGFPCVDTMCTFPEFESLLTEMYARIGATVTFSRAPLMRDLRDANSGTVDGSLARSPKIIKKYPNLIPVPPAIGRYSLSIFTISPALADKPLKDLKGYAVGHLRGDQTAAALMEKTGLDASSHSSIPGMLRMLKSHHLDAAVLPTTITRMAIPTPMLKPLHVSEPLVQTLFYHSLNKRHEKIVPQLSEALRSMYRDGTAQKLLGKYADFEPE